MTGGPARAPKMPSPDDEVTVTGGPAGLRIGPLRPAEHGALYDAFDHVVSAGEGYPHAPPLTPEVFEATWLRTTAVVAARDQRGLLGAYHLKPNFVGRAAHIANAGYLVVPTARRRGVGRALVEDSIWRAPLLGFDAIQFNLVFESNPARALYEALGWRRTGLVPAAVDGEDAVIYWRAVP